MRGHNYFIMHRPRKQLNSTLELVMIYEQAFPYMLDTMAVNSGADVNRAFDVWLAFQLEKLEKRLIFDKLMLSIDEIVKTKKSMCQDIVQIRKQHSTIPLPFDTEKLVISLIDSKCEMIERAHTYTVLYTSQLSPEEIQEFMATIDLGKDNAFVKKAGTILIETLSTINAVNK